MLNSILKATVKLAVLFALVKFVILPMIPGSFNFPSPTDFLKDPLGFGKQALAQFDPTKFLPKAPNAPDPGQVGRDFDDGRRHLENEGKKLANHLSPF